MRFALLTTFYPPYNFGGDGIGVQRLAHALARRGHDVTVVHDVDAHQVLSPEPAPPPRDDPLVRVVPVSSGLGRAGLLTTYELGRPVATARRLHEIVDGGAFDVVHFHNVSLLGGPGLLSLGGDAIRLYTAHEHWLVCPTHVLWRDGREPCDQRRCFRCTIRHRRPPQLWRWTAMMDRQARHVDEFLALSEFSRDKHHAMGFSPAMQVLPPFLPDPVENGPPDRTGTSPHHRPYFLFVGRLETIKGLDHAIAAMRRHPQADLLIAGDGSRAADLRSSAADMPNVRFVGRLDAPELERYYRHALALVVPSVGYETFGLVIIEAFAQGLPVIARDIGPYEETVARAGGGIMFRTEDELVQALSAIQNEPGLGQRLGAAGYRGYVDLWSERAVMPRYFDVIRAAAVRRGNLPLLDKLQDDVC